jgi:protoporphyrinogen oxidase
MFSRDQDVLDFMIASLGDNVHQSRRNNRVFVDGRMVKYPLENDLASLTLDARSRCLLDYLFNDIRISPRTRRISTSGSSAISARV